MSLSKTANNIGLVSYLELVRQQLKGKEFYGFLWLSSVFAEVELAFS